MAPGLEQRECGAPPFGLPEFHFGLGAQPCQLRRVHEGEQSWFEGCRELQWKPQVRMPRRKGQNLGSEVRHDAEASEQLQLFASGRRITPSVEGLADERDELLQGWRWRVEVPASPIGVLQCHDAAMAGQPEVGRQLFLDSPERGELEPRVYQVERPWLQ